MNIIICGAGRVGFTIAKLLTEQNHSITVIDQSGDDIPVSYTHLTLPTIVDVYISAKPKYLSNFN